MISIYEGRPQKVKVLEGRGKGIGFRCVLNKSGENPVADAATGGPSKIGHFTKVMKCFSESRKIR